MGYGFDDGSVEVSVKCLSNEEWEEVAPQCLRELLLFFVVVWSLVNHQHSLICSLVISHSFPLLAKDLILKFIL